MEHSGCRRFTKWHSPRDSWNSAAIWFKFWVSTPKVKSCVKNVYVYVMENKRGKNCLKYNTPPGAKLGICRRTIYSKLSTSDHNLFQIFLRESKFFFEHQIFLSLSLSLSLGQILNSDLASSYFPFNTPTVWQWQKNLVLKEKFGFLKKNLE